MSAELDGVYTFCLRWTGDEDQARRLAVRACAVCGGLAAYGEAARICQEAGRPVHGRDQRLPHDEEARLHVALGAVGDDELAVLLLRDVVGLDTDQVAAALDLARSSVTARLQRGRLAFAQRLSG